MFRQFVLLLVLCTVGTLGSPSRIVGGSITTIEQYPDTVQVEFRDLLFEIWNQRCAGTVLTTRFILSAASCFSGLLYAPRLRRIRAGTLYRSRDGVTINVVQAFNHPTFGSRGNDGDITVVELQEPLVYSDVIKQGTIISQASVIPDGVAVVQVGWGVLEIGGISATQIRDVTVHTVNNEVCRERYASIPFFSSVVTENMICAGELDVGGKDACTNDAGGPMYYDVNGQNVIVGVISWGQGCGDPRYPGVSTYVPSYSNWIIDVVNNN